MDWQLLFTIFKESIYVLVVFGSFLILGLWKGRYFLVTFIFSLYLSLLFLLQFPFLENITSFSPLGSGVTQTIVLSLFTIASFFLFRRHIPGDDYEKTLENFPLKVLLSGAATVLVLAFTYTILPLSGIVGIDTPLEKLFATEAYFFWWLILPLMVLFFI